MEVFSKHGDFLEVCQREFLVVNLVYHVFIVEVKKK